MDATIPEFFFQTTSNSRYSESTSKPGFEGNDCDFNKLAGRQMSWLTVSLSICFWRTAIAPTQP